MITTAFAVAVTLLSATPMPAPSLEEVARQECKHNKNPAADRISALLDIEREAGVPDLVRGILVAAACRESGYKHDKSGDGGKAKGIVQFWSWARPPIRKIRKRLCKSLPEDQRRSSPRCRWLADPREDWFAAATYWAQRLVQKYEVAQGCIDLDSDGTCKNYSEPLCTDQNGYSSMEVMWWASANLTVGWAPTCHTRGRCIERNPDKTCKRYGCARWGVHCARKGSKRMETKHMKVLRHWQEVVSEIGSAPR
jgi:hypothetical protein